MSPWQQTYRSAVIALAIAVAVIALPGVMIAQPDNQQAPKAELFVGYEWLNPGGNIPDQSVPPNAFHLPSMPHGGGGSLAWNFNNYLSLEGNWGINSNKYATINTAGIGPRLTYRGPDGINFFAHTLLGFQRLSAKHMDSSNGMAAILGGGMDIRVWKPLSLRLFEADFVWAHHNFGDVVPPTNPGLRRSDFDGARLATGLVFNFGGGAPEAPVAAACSVQNADVMVGEPVHVTVAASNFNPKHPLTYTWAASGGKIEGKDTSATVDTNGIAGGSYTATATVTDPKAKKNNTASCTANFTVKEPPKNPPQMSCSASPASVQAGTASTITCTCTSPDNVPVTVGSWSASGGSISGSGNSATLNTAGAASGPITVNATCTDSRGLTASASSSVTVENPPPPPPQATKVNQCDYPNAKKPWRVDNTCKAMLDDVAGKLQQDPDAKLVVVGNADPAEAKKSRHKNLAAERAVDVKYYLTEGEAQQHIDASRIECRTGTEGGATSEQWIIPAGASFPEASSTTPVDETKVKPILDHPKPAAKKAAKKAK
jgi:outer membrane protein OmpA-like peptidoglycan-associated protein